MHKNMSVSERVENALCGYVLLDIFKLVAQKECRRRGLPGGSLWMAPQTRRNMQYVVQGFITALLGKDPCGNPWKASHHRWTELPIEMWFGRLRQRAQNSQFNAKQYWSQVAAEMRNVHKSGLGKSDDSIVNPPTDQEFHDASVNALKSAIKLGAWCSGVTETSLQAAYAESAHNLISASDAAEPFHEWERDEQEDWEEDEQPDTEQHAKSRWKELLQHVRDSAAASLKESDKDEVPKDPETAVEGDLNGQDPAPAVDEWKDLVSVADGLDLKELCETDKADGEEKAQDDVPALSLLRTLRQALAAAADQSSLEQFDKIWRLLMFLRYWHGGMDQHWIKNPRACRKASTKMRWYRFLGMHFDP